MLPTPAAPPVPHRPRIAILGGGPGGLFTAYRLQQQCALPYDLTIYEASGRVGGKIRTEQFATAPVAYEAGAAELYDYSHRGEDPLRELILELGLSIQPMDGRAVVVDGKIVQDTEDVGRHFGPAAREALARFDARAHQWMSPQEYYDSDWTDRSSDPLAGQTFQQELERVEDADARRFLSVMVHSDLATEPHLTSASYGLQNYLMNDPDYMRLYTIVGGIERLPEAVAQQIEARILLQERVTHVERSGKQVRVRSVRDGQSREETYDFVIAALPNSYLPSIAWCGDGLREAMHRHHTNFEYPAHYLRVSVLFREAFWKHELTDSYLMLDAFGGCCLYNESSRNGCAEYGTLGWLLAGNAAMTAANQTDEQLIALALASLPASMKAGAGQFLEGRVQRWIGEVNGLPGGGEPALDMDSRHIPQPEQPNLFVVGDYLFDSTLNGVLDSADYVAELLTEELQATTSPIAAAEPAALSGVA